MNMNNTGLIKINLEPQKENLTTLGIFISSILLSFAGCMSVIISEIRKSKCSNISCGDLSCDRDIENN